MTDPYLDLENAAHPLNKMPREYFPAVVMPDDCIIETPRDLVPDQVARHFRPVDRELSERVRDAQVFDFGLTDVTIDGSRLPYILELFTGRFIDTPYQCVLYQCGLKLNRLALVIDRLKLLPPNITCAYRTILYAQDREAKTFGLMGTAIYGFEQRDEPTINFEFMPSREIFEGRCKFISQHAPQDHVNQQLSDLAVHWFLNCALALATDGVPRRVQKASALINAERVRKGKPRVPTVTHINFREYLAALDAQPGHHASPVPHLRRGHIRHLADGRRVWVRDCLVNASKDVQTDRRGRYVVHPAEDPS